ncbi:MAG: Hpt domain-containing protein [Phycisphaerae bacterium]|nr:Hpt domain-containing protein [Phycisphaerae bacterium]
MDQQKNNMEMTDYPVDWADVYGRIGDEDIIAEFAASFLKNSQTLILSLKSAVNAHSTDQIELYAHALKGSASNIGAIVLAKAAWQLEKAGSEKIVRDVDEQFAVVEQEYATLKELFESPDWMEHAKRAAEAKI